MNLPVEDTGNWINPGGASTFDATLEEDGTVTLALAAIAIRRGTGECRTLEPHRPGDVRCGNC